MPIMLKRTDGSVTPFRNAEYIPFYYFIPKSILSRCRASHGITSRDFVCQSPNHSRNRLTLWGGAAPNPPKGEMCMGKDVRIAVRVTVIEKEKIQAKARKCGLSTTEYVKQRALGYEPRAVPPDALFACIEKLGELADKASSPELDKEICTVLKQTTAEFLFPGKG